MVEKHTDVATPYELAAEDRKKSAAVEIGDQDMVARVPRAAELCRDDKRMPQLESG